MIPLRHATPLTPATDAAPKERRNHSHQTRETEGNVHVFQRNNYFASSSRRPDKRVRFAPSAPVVIKAGTHEAERVWWHKAELTEILHSAKTRSKDFGRRGLLMEGLDQAYNRARRIATAVDDEDRLTKRLKGIQVNDSLIQWSRYGHSKRGLEKWCSAAQHKVRLDASRHQKSVVLGFDGDDADELARISESTSRTARIFARLIGEADAIAISNTASPMEKSIGSLGMAGRRFSLPTGVGFSCATDAYWSSPASTGLQQQSSDVLQDSMMISSSALPTPPLRRSITIPVSFSPSHQTMMSPRTFCREATTATALPTMSPISTRSSLEAGSPKTIMLPGFISFTKKY